MGSSSMEMGDLGSLLQAAEELTTQIDEAGAGAGEFPRVERNLRQIFEAGQQLYTRSTQPLTSDTQAVILLGSRGVDVPRIAEKLESLSAARTLEPLEPLKDTDIEGFLKNERENAILAIIEETRKTTFENCEKLYWDSLQSSWEKHKQKVLSSLTGTDDNDLLDVSLPLAQTSVAADSVHGPSNLGQQEMAYAAAVIAYNQTVLQGGVKPSLVDKFLNVAQNMGDENALELWSILVAMTQVSAKPRSHAATQRAFMGNARQHLESRYRTYMESWVYGQLGRAKLGGKPGTLPLVTAFMQAKHVELEAGLEGLRPNEMAPWPAVYYCLRCGDVAAALQAAKRAGGVLGEILPALEELLQSPERRLNPSAEAQLRLQYRRSVRTTTDPYKRVVYCVLGACDVSDDHTEVCTSTDDYLWLKLWQLREEDEDHSQDRMSYTHFQKLIMDEYGERYFNAMQEPFLYCSVLLLTAQFEAAIEFLARAGPYSLRSLAVHLALALYETGLLLLPASIQSPLLSKEATDKPPVHRLNLARLVMLYTRQFEATDPKEALHYFYFLRNLKGSKGESLFTACVTELVLESREFGLLLGTLDVSGRRVPGLVDQFAGPVVDVSQVIQVVAESSESQGLSEDAVRLYDLAGQENKVLELLVRLLSHSVTQVTTSESAAYRIYHLALSVAHRIRNQGTAADSTLAPAFFLLLDVATFFALYHAGKHAEALEAMSKLKLLPLQPEEVETRVNQFRHLKEDIRRTLPDVLLATMNILYANYRKYKSGGTPGRWEERDKGKLTEQVRSQVRALITFAGMIPYRMPGDTSARLVQMEHMMV